MIHGPGVLWSANNGDDNPSDVDDAANNVDDNASDVDDDDEEEDDDCEVSIDSAKGQLQQVIHPTIAHHPPLASSTTIVQITMMSIITSVDFLVITMTLLPLAVMIFT